MKQKIKRTADWASRLYDSKVGWAIRKTVARTRFVDPCKDIRTLSDKYDLHLTDCEVQESVRTSLIDVIGREKAENLATRIIRSHGLKAAVVTGFCALPHNALMWPLMIVDIIFFERSMSVVRNQLRIVYGDIEVECKDDVYAYVVPPIIKVEAVLLRHQILRYIKTGVGKGTRYAIEHSVIFTRATLRSLIRQAVKWLGINLSFAAMEDVVNWVIFVLSTIVAALISYWIMVPMARHFQKELQRKTSKL